MLLQFNFSNFKSFRDEVSLDMSSAKITEHPHHVVNVGNERVLPVAALYGANASGKSNVIEAFRFMRAYVIQSFAYGDGEGLDQGRQRKRLAIPFALDQESRDGATFFEVYFVSSEREKYRTYHYGFTLKGSTIQEEWLNSRAKTSNKAFSRLFYRSGESLDLSGLPQEHRDNLKIALSKETLLVSLGAKLQVPVLSYTRDWFQGCEVADFGRPVENFLLSGQLPQDFAESKSVQEDVLRYFASFDPSIIDFEVEEVENSKSEGRSHYHVASVHKAIDSEDKIAFPLEYESAGTLKMLALFPLLKKVFGTGGVFLVDELSARLHPLLLRSLLISFLDPAMNPHHAQLIFTSHEPWHMSNQILRRDEVWFVEKAKNGVSSLYSLADFVDEDGVKIRKDENYERNYLLGKYGAIPSMTLFDMVGEG